MRENRFQAELIQDLNHIFIGCVVLKNDANYIQGIPDLTILYKNHWAMLECKRSISEPYQPNQEFYIDELDEMSFARVVCPENKEEVLNELQRAFRIKRPTRISKSK